MRVVPGTLTRHTALTWISQLKFKCNNYGQWLIAEGDREREKRKKCYKYTKAIAFDGQFAFSFIVVSLGMRLFNGGISHR